MVKKLNPNSKYAQCQNDLSVARRKINKQLTAIQALHEQNSVLMHENEVLLEALLDKTKTNAFLEADKELIASGLNKSVVFSTVALIIIVGYTLINFLLPIFHS